MTTFKPSSGFRNTIKSCRRNLFYALVTVSACAALLAPPQRRAQALAAYQSMHDRSPIGLTRASSKWICISILSSCVLNQWRSISIDLTRTSSKWICFGYVWNRDVTVLQFGYAAFMVEIFYVRWSILDQSLHWDLFMRDITVNISLLYPSLKVSWLVVGQLRIMWLSDEPAIRGSRE